MAQVKHDEIRNKDLLALRAYITAEETGIQNIHDATVLLDLTHSNLTQRHIEIRFDKHDPLDTLRRRIHQKTGTSPGFQHLQVLNGQQILHEIPPETSGDYPLGYFGLEHHGMVVHCIDLDPYSGSKGGQYEDTSLVQKFRLSDEEYNARQGTLRDWSNQQKAKNPNFTLAKHAQHHRELMEAQRQHKLGLPLPPGFFVDSAGTVVRDDDEEEATPCPKNDTVVVDPQYDEQSVAGVEVGQRCQVKPGKRRGKVSFVGEIPELGPGYWIGVTFDEPVGQNNGCVGQEKKRYFEALDGHGGFVRGKNCQVGDFPERDLLDSDDDEEDSDDEDEL